MAMDGSPLTPALSPGGGEGGFFWGRVSQGGHGATVTEMMRMPFWFWTATGNANYRQIGEQAIATVKRWSMPSGALVSQDAVDTRPNPWNVGYEYCAMFEQEFSYLRAGRATGKTGCFDDVEHLWFNAMQGSREPDGSAILYCTDENRLSVHNEHGDRERFTPTGQHVAVCCNPNSTRVASYYAEITVCVVIPENAIIQLRRGPHDGDVNLDCLKGEK